MFKKSKSGQALDINQQEIATVIGYGVEINGELNGPSVIRIDGKVNGNVTVENGIILGDKGVVIGNIVTKSAIIYGVIDGNVTVNQLEIKKTGKVNGDIKTEILEIELGAQYNGNLKMNQLIKTEEKTLKAV